MDRVKQQKRGIKLTPGSKVYYDNSPHLIHRVLDFNSLLLKTPTGEIIRIKVSDIKNEAIEKENNTDHQQIDLFSEAEWDVAKKRFEIIEPLLSIRNEMTIIETASDSGVSRATIFRWIKLYESTGLISSLVPTKKHGGKGKSRLTEEQDILLNDIIEKEYLSKQRKSVQKVIDIIIKECYNGKIKTPHPATIRRKIQQLSEHLKISKRIDKKYADHFYAPIRGKFPGADFPLSVVQIDHTKVDIMLVDELNRKALGRPWITVAIDVFSRMITGFYVSFDPAGAIGTGVCIANSILPKDKWLAKYEIGGEWPCWGVMKTIHLDNAKEFHGMMLQRASEEYNINISWRPVAQPHWGGHIERLIGTLLGEIHTLPGTTFSNPTKRKGYDSEGNAVMTLFEFEKWLTHYIVNVYHNKTHSGIGMSPIEKYKEGVFGKGDQTGTGLPDRIIDERKLKLDFLPFYKRAILPYGVVIEHIFYYHEILKKYIHATDKLNNKSRTKTMFIFKRDPRDISVIYFFDPETKEYYDIPYRDFSHPPISIWDYKNSISHLKKIGTQIINETLIFEAYGHLNKMVEDSKSKTKKAKRSYLKGISRNSTKKEIKASEIIEDVSKKLPPTILNFNIKPFTEQDNGSSK